MGKTLNYSLLHLFPYCLREEAGRWVKITKEEAGRWVKKNNKGGREAEYIVITRVFYIFTLPLNQYNKSDGTF
jgi:hypothetical protein